MIANQYDFAADLRRVQSFCGWQDCFTLSKYAKTSSKQSPPRNCSAMRLSQSGDVLWTSLTRPKKLSQTDPPLARSRSPAPRRILAWTSQRHKTTLHHSQPPLNSPRCPCRLVLRYQGQRMSITEGTVMQPMLTSSHVVSKIAIPRVETFR